MTYGYMEHFCFSFFGFCMLFVEKKKNKVVLSKEFLNLKIGPKFKTIVHANLKFAMRITFIRMFQMRKVITKFKTVGCAVVQEIL